MSTTFAIDDGSAAPSESSSVEEDSIVYSRYSSMALLAHRHPTLRRSRRSEHPPASNLSPLRDIPADDNQTANRCREALRWITTLPEGSVNLEVHAGSVTLQGTVHCNAERDAAAAAIRQIESVAKIDNRIDVE